ncbi:MAG: biotin carboxylase N-terminal domain-containing protein [Pseudomonadota bacterium]
MFDTILIANRGEIACRVARTARAMGVKTVAVYSSVDAQAAHVAAADRALPIGGATPQESYLRGDRIIEAALKAGAQAIHPGYGFLSENPDFVTAVEAAGLTFIGPSAEAIRAMGLKDAAKAVMEAAGVPVVPGYHGADQDPARLAAAADAIGYPVLIKAVAGGGGKGMRLVDDPSGFAAALQGAQAEALAAFDNAAVLVEKFIAAPRHIEIQVFGDGQQAVHLFERDCSVQRRHQKVFEEAPAPDMSAEMRQAMGAAAVRAAQAIGYRGAGTVEFIVDGSGPLRPDGFWFMEMNTRLQVEHPVTEAVTGLDLVAWQLRVAVGEPLPRAQDQIALTGHAIEARLYAEDVAKGFLPATGTLRHLLFPSGIRVDTGVRAGDTISPHYDPMIAKLIAHGATREEALARLRHGLDAVEISGCETNHAFLRRVTRSAAFREGGVDTGFIEAEGPDFLADPVPCSRARSLAALGALGLCRAPRPEDGFALWGPLAPVIQRLDWRGEAVEVAVTIHGPGLFETRIGGAHHRIAWHEGGFSIDEQAFAVAVRVDEPHVTVFWGNCYPFTIPDPLAPRVEAGAASRIVTAPMPGLVKAVDVAAGASVQAGARLAVLEAMKMEHALTAHADAVVAEVLVTPGSQVDAGAPLIRFAEPEE